MLLRRHGDPVKLLPCVSVKMMLIHFQLLTELHILKDVGDL
jgi:hypothetical protein